MHFTGRGNAPQGAYSLCRKNHSHHSLQLHEFECYILGSICSLHVKATLLTAQVLTAAAADILMHLVHTQNTLILLHNRQSEEAS